MAVDTTPGNDPGSIRILLEEVLDLSIPDDDVDLFETGLLDSVGMVNVLARLEEDYRIEIPLDELELDTFGTPRAIARFVQGRAEARAGTS